ncbi:MAG: hypothetical protein MUE99_11260, partial [Chitinophagaceae bacterium]|nr:hypothetical protein [Chitinophagaceae bacterium]
MISISIFLSSILLGQNTISLPLIKNFSKTVYKGGSQTWGIDQDKHDRMVFANNEGLLIYDGSYWKIYPLPNLTIVRSVKVAPGGKIFVGGQGEAGYFTPDPSGHLSYHSILDFIPEDQRDFADVWDIELMGESVFFRATDRIFLLNNQSVLVFPAPQEWVYMEKVDDQLFAQDKSEGLFRWSGQDWLPVDNGKQVVGDVIHGAVKNDANDLVFITFHRNAFVYKNRILTKTKFADFPFKSDLVNVFSVNENEYVLGTTADGCWIINRRGEIIQHLSTSEGLQDNGIICLYRDRGGNIWTGLYNGISMIAYNAPLKFIKPSTKNELSGYSSRIFENKLYIATNEGAYVSNLSRTSGDLSFIKGDFTQVPNSYGLAYRFDEVNKQLMMAHNEGTYIIENGSAVKLSPDPSWTFEPASRVFPSSKVMVGNYTGIKWLQYNKSRFFPTDNLKGIRESFRFLAIDNDLQTWASHPYRGVYKINFSGDSTSFTAKLYTEKNGLPSKLDNHVFRVKNRVVFATSAGIYEYNKSTDSFEPSSMLNPVFGNTPIRYLKEDEAGNLWFVSGKSAGYLSFQPNKTPSYKIAYFPEITGQILSGFENFYPFDPENVFV